MNKKTVEDVDLDSKRVFVRVDFNVPQDEAGNITDDARIKAALPTIKYLIDHKARVILASHLGRPKGQVVDKLKMDPIAERTSELLGKEVKKLDDCIGEEVEKAVSEMKEGDVILLENLRFHKGEEKNDEEFAKKLASLADVYVNDAFGTSHRAHASTEGITKFLPVAVAGYLVGKELRIMGKAMENPDRPFVAILGGKKVSDKIPAVDNLLDKVDTLIVGGGMSYTFLKALGYEVGTSLLEEDKVELAKQLMEKAKKKGVNFILPTDVVVADKFSDDANTKVVSADSIPADWMGLDMGPRTVEKVKEALKGAKTVIWNGPVGVFEMDKFAMGTTAIAKMLADSDATIIIGGGDSAAAVKKIGLTDKMTHVSTGGGASLEFFEGKVLPGIAALNDN